MKETEANALPKFIIHSIKKLLEALKKQKELCWADKLEPSESVL